MLVWLQIERKASFVGRFYDDLLIMQCGLTFLAHPVESSFFVKIDLLTKFLGQGQGNTNMKSMSVTTLRVYKSGTPWPTNLVFCTSGHLFATYVMVGCQGHGLKVKVTAVKENKTEGNPILLRKSEEMHYTVWQ